AAQRSLRRRRASPRPRRPRARRRAPARLGQLSRVRTRMPALPFTADLGAALLAAPVRRAPRGLDYAVRADLRLAEADMTLEPASLVLHLRAVGLIMAGLVALNVCVPGR